MLISSASFCSQISQKVVDILNIVILISKVDSADNADSKVVKIERLFLKLFAVYEPNLVMFQLTKVLKTAYDFESPHVFLLLYLVYIRQIRVAIV